MNDVNRLLARRRQLTRPVRLERIRRPFVWLPTRPANSRLAVVAGDLVGAAGTTETLVCSGYRLTLYAALESLLAKLRRHPRRFDLVILDGGRSAKIIVSALQILRAESPALPIVLIAGDDPCVRARARRLRVQEVLAPPVYPVDLRAAIAAVLSSDPKAAGTGTSGIQGRRCVEDRTGASPSSASSKFQTTHHIAAFGATLADSMLAHGEDRQNGEE